MLCAVALSVSRIVLSFGDNIHSPTLYLLAKRSLAPESEQARKVLRISAGSTIHFETPDHLGMDACGSLGTGACRERDLWDHLHSHQRPAAQNPATESPRRRFAWRSVDGLDWCHDTRARLSRGELRHHRAVARDDAHLGLPLSRPLFRMGRRRSLGIFAHSGAVAALYHAHIGNSLGVAGQRHDLFDANTACHRGNPARKTADAALSHRA